MLPTKQLLMGAELSDNAQRLDEISDRYGLPCTLAELDVLDPAVISRQAERMRNEFVQLQPQRALRENDRVVIQHAIEARQRRERIEHAAQRWSVIFSDCVQDLLTDFNHDLRRRTRAVTTDVEQNIDDCDPAAARAELDAHLTNGIDAALHQNSLFILQATIELNRRLADHFDGLLGGLPGLNAHLLRPLGGFDSELEIPDAPKRGAAMFTGMRGSYGGIALCGTAFAMAGPALGAAAAAIVLPLTLLAGVLFGRKVASDERARQLTQRRSVAKQKARRRMEDVLFHENKHRRDAIRTWSRVVRETLVQRIDELQSAAARVEKESSKAVETYRQQAEQWWQGVQVDMAELGRLAELLVPGSQSGRNDPSTTEKVVLRLSMP